MVGIKLKNLREEVFLANLELKNRDLVIYTFGNVSGIDRKKGIFVIKPSGVDYPDLTPENMVLVDLDGKKVDGDLNPSSDTKTHLVLYREFEKIGGIAHTHSPYATSWAQAQRPIDCMGTTHADYFYGQIPCTDPLSPEEIDKDYESETGNVIVRTFREKRLDYEKIKGVLVASHGPFTWGSNASEAVFLSVMLENIAMMNLFTLIINGNKKTIPISLLNKHFLRKHGKNAYYGQSK